MTGVVTVEADNRAFFAFVSYFLFVIVEYGEKYVTVE